MILTFAALASALCSTASAGEVTLWHAYRGDERTTLEALSSEYGAAHVGTTVLPVFVPYENLANKLQSAIPHGNGPDLFVYAHERVGDWSTIGLIQPVEIPTNQFHPVTVEAFRYHDRSWAFPLAYKSLALFRNTTLVPDAPGTTDDLVATAERLTAGDQYGLAFEVASAYQNAPWMHGFGGGVFRDGKVALDTAENAAGLAFVKTLADSVVPADPTGALVTQLFNEGRAAMVVNGPWFLGEIDSSIAFAVSPLPVVSATGKPAAPYVGVEGIFVAREGEDARAVATWLASDEIATRRAAMARQAVPNLNTTTNDPVLAAFRAQLETAVPMPNVPEMGQTWEPLARALRRLMRGTATPAEAVAEAQSVYLTFAEPVPAAANPLPYIVALTIFLAWWFVSRARLVRQLDLRRWRFVLPWVVPAISAMTLLVLLPFLVGAGVSLFEFDGAEWTFVGGVRFLDILLSRDFPITSPFSFWSTLAVTVLWTVSNVVMHVSIGVALAMLLREPWIRMRGVFRALLILPWAIPSYITALVWKGMFHRQFGAINAILGWLGIAPVSWFGNFWTALAANVATNTWLGFPFMMVVTLGALQSVPRDLEEAAEIDGASWIERFRHVTLPLLKPALLPAVILGSVWTFNMFNVIFLVSGGEPDGSTDILISQAYRWAFTRGHRYGYASAYAMIIFGVLVLYGRGMNRLAGKKVV